MFEYLQLQHARFKTLCAYRYGDWKKISIKECGEKLVQVPNEIVFPFYAKTMKLTEDKRIFLRESTLTKTLEARKYLQKIGYDLRVYDGWRSTELQENLFWHYMREFTAKQFGKYDEIKNLSSSEMKAHFENFPPELRATMIGANRTYVSLPSKDVLCPSPHSTGGSVDVWLFKDGEAENLGVPFDWMEKNAGAFYHLKIRRNRFSGNDRLICQNRKLLLLAMIKASLTCYGPEIWHFNYGNQMDALVKGGHAIYSYIEP